MAVFFKKMGWEVASRDPEIKDLRWQDFRHTFCSRLAQAGASPKVIQEASGHKTISELRFALSHDHVSDHHSSEGNSERLRLSYRALTSHSLGFLWHQSGIESL
jgi:integrase